MIGLRVPCVTLCSTISSAGLSGINFCFFAFLIILRNVILSLDTIEKDESLVTFEKVLYNDNKDLCNELFGTDAENYMLKNKTETAFTLLNNDNELIVPDYIREAIEWIRR